MADPRDIVEIDGIHPSRKRGSEAAASNRSDKGPSAKFLSVWFRCCNMYGRMHRNAAATMYEGRCPKCGAAVSAKIGEGGTSRRMFEAR